MGKVIREMIPLIDGVDVPNDVIEDMLEKHDYSCHYDHQVLQVEDDGGRLAEWLKENGYEFKYHKIKHGFCDWIAFIGT